MSAKLVIFVIAIIAVAIAILVTAPGGFTSICDGDIVFANDPRAPELLCAYKRGAVVECGLTPLAVIQRCRGGAR